MGSAMAAGAGIMTTQAGAYYSTALKTGDGSTVAAIAGTYPAVSFVISVVFGLEKANFYKILGVVFAAASCFCFSMS